MRRTIAVIMTLLLLCGACIGETTDEEFDFAFDDDGYTGVWTPVDELGLVFCLPDGWVEQVPELGAAFSAVSADGTVRMDIGLEADSVDSLWYWADNNLSEYDRETAGLYQAVVVETEDQMQIRLLDDDRRMIVFRIERDSQDALPRYAALQIAGTLSGGWGDEGAFFESEEDNNEILN